MVAVPRDASTIILMRDAGSRKELEMLMLRRNLKSQFLPGAYVFPGGSLEDCDCSAEAVQLSCRLSMEAATSVLKDAKSPAIALGLFVASIRELFEEAGVLLAYDNNMELVNTSAAREKFVQYRKRVREEPASFLSMLAEEGLLLATDRLHYYAHWITPEIAPIRYDTRFFVAELPPGQEAVHDQTETTDSLWISPREAIEGRREERISIVFPTFCNIRDLLPYSSVKKAIESTLNKEIVTIQPLINMLQFG